MAYDHLMQHDRNTNRLQPQTAESVIGELVAQGWSAGGGGGEGGGVTDHGTVTAEVLVTGSGGLSEPRLPAIEGIDSFGAGSSTPPAGTTTPTSPATTAPASRCWP